MCQADRYRTIQVKRYTLIFPAPHYTPDPYSTRAPYSTRTPQSTPASSSTPAPLSTLALADSSEPLTIPCFFNLLLSLLLLLPSPSPHPTSAIHSTPTCPISHPISSPSLYSSPLRYSGPLLY